MAAVRKDGRGLPVTVRQFHPSDLLEVRRIFKAGLLRLPFLAFRHALLSPVAPTLVLTTGGATYAASRSMLWATLSIAGLLALIYLACWDIFARFVRNKLKDDMADIKGSYLDTPGAGFWVAEEEGGRSGLLGIVAAQPVEGETESCELLRLSVDRRFRRLGLGRRLTENILEFARAQGYRECLLHTTMVQEDALRVYGSVGFRVHKDYVPLPGQAFISWLTNIYLCELRYSLRPEAAYKMGNTE
ncbi:probable N-acetyltransferase CML1 isoform X2 [Narcine bancroftii]